MQQHPTPAQGAGHGAPAAPSAEATFVLQHRRRSVSVSVQAALDTKLSCDARAAYFILSALPEHWRFDMKALGEVCRMGRDKLRNAMRELRQAGYVTLDVRRADGTGRYDGWIAILFEEPQVADGTPSPSDWNSGGRSHRVTESPAPEFQGDGVLLNNSEDITNPQSGLNSPADPIRILHSIPTTPPIVPPAAPSSPPSPSQVDRENPKDDRKQREAEAVEEVLADWRAATGRNRFFRPVDDSWKKVRAALRYGFTRAQLRLAVAGALATPWNCGENPNGKKYLNPDNIFRSSETIDRHMDTARTRCTPENWWPAPDADSAASPAGMDAPAPEPEERAMTGFDLDMQALVQELFATRQDRGRIIAIKRRLGCLGEEVGVRGVVFPPFPEEFEALEVAA